MAKTPLVVATVALLLLAALPAACDGKPGELQVRGRVVEVVPRNFSELESLRISTESGQVYLFETEGFVGFTPSHVREHQLLGQSILVTYLERGDRLVAVALAD